jgi:protein-tyrosine-phosphatase
LPSIVFVCTGNICRSPMAEGILRYRMHELGRDDFRIASMGIHGLDEHRASESAIVVSADAGIDISGHISRPLLPEELNGADLIFTMELIQKEFIDIFFPPVSDRTFLLGSWPGKEKKKNNIKDPIGGSFNDYHKTFELLYSHIDRIVPELLDKFPKRSHVGQ